LISTETVMKQPKKSKMARARASVISLMFAVLAAVFVLVRSDDEKGTKHSGAAK
jgi:hypothetical protein